MTTHEERAAATRQEMLDEAGWDVVPATADPPKRLTAQVVIRLDAETAERSRALGEAYDTPYTALLRRWLNERIRHEWDALTRARRIDNGRVVVRPVGGGWEVQRSGTDSDGRIGMYQQLATAEKVAKVVADAEQRAYHVDAA